MKFKQITCGLLIAGAGLALAACTNLPPPGQHVEIPPEMAKSKRPTSETLARAGGPMDSATTANLLRRQRLEATAQGPERVGTAMIENAPGELRKVKYATRDAAPEDVIRVLVGEYMHRSYLIDPKLSATKQMVTMDVDAEMTKQDVEDLLGAIATLHGWSIEDRGGTLVIGASAMMSKSSVAPLLDAASAAPSDRVATRAFRLHHIGAKEASEAVKELVSEGAKTVISGRTLVIADRVRQLNRLGKLIQSLDVASFDGVEIWTYELSNEKAPDAAKLLTAIATATLGGPAGQNEAAVSFVALPRGNRVMVISRDPSAQAMVRQWVDQVDQDPATNSRQRYLYRIQNVDPAKLNTLLRATFIDRLEKDATQGASEVSDTAMRLTVDPEEDLLIVYATPKDYNDLLAVLTRIDVPRQQVMLQTVISEVSLTDQLAYGVEYFLQTDVGSKILNLIGKATQFGPTDALATGSAFLIGSDGFAVVKALEQNTDVKIITTPKLFGRDKDLAKFQFGGEVPIVTANIDSSVQQNGNTGIRQDIQYKPTGVILEMQPKINESGDVTLHIKLEIRDVRPSSTTSGIESPEFTVRLVDTTAIIPHGATLLLGGIIDARDTHLLGKIPLLGDIPILGLAFQNQNNDKERKELLLAVTPIIVNDAHEAEPLVGQFLASAYGVEAALRAFDGALAPVLAHAVLEAEPIDELHEPPASLEREAPKSRPEQIPPKPTGTRAALALTRLAAAMPDQQSEEIQIVALFLNGLTEAALGDRGQ